MNQQEKTPRELALENLFKETTFAMTRDIVSATTFLKRAKEIRAGKQAQRKTKRTEQRNRWKKKFDTPLSW